ncbi:MAG TPA: cysteine dioxygenase family protein [Chthoniobacterales bacterium]|nr:cysteine dioxygenase family protein [Chthoniobacterales bacterium]
MTSTISIPTVKSSALDELISAVRHVVQTGDDAARTGAAVAELLQPYLQMPDFLTAEQMEPDETCYCRHLLHVEPDGSFSIVALVWLPGQETAIHDHVSWCVVGVHRGEEDETTYRLAGDESDRHLVVTGHAVNPVGAVVALVPPGDIHRVKNSCDGIAVSLHVYGADVQTLGSSILRCYTHEIRASSPSASQLA